MAGRKIAIKAVDWAKLGASIPKALSADFNGFRVKHEEIRGRLLLLPEKPTPIDWSYYQKNVKNQALVKKFHDAYSKVVVPRPVDTESKNIENKKKEFDIEAMKANEETTAAIAQLQAEIEQIENSKPFEEMTPEEYVEKHPDIAKKTLAEMKEMGFR
ncbi:ATP synthase subunit d, mitochondrial isoform X2 [Hydra vulgaris]|uniref:ATP synthase subunit d, mitochondrial n=1 Tax=Hydra vulgaris TaxID=6087 RepID=A0ABM4C8F0_HYDVU